MKRVPIDMSMLTDKERKSIESAKYSGIIQIVVTGNTQQMIDIKIKHIKKAIKECNDLGV